MGVTSARERLVLSELRAALADPSRPDLCVRILLDRARASRLVAAPDGGRTSCARELAAALGFCCDRTGASRGSQHDGEERGAIASEEEAEGAEGAEGAGGWERGEGEEGRGPGREWASVEGGSESAGRAEDDGPSASPPPPSSPGGSFPFLPPPSPPPRASVSLFQAPDQARPRDGSSRADPLPAPEFGGMQHIRCLVFDDDVILTSADLAEPFFSSRAERYVRFRGAEALAQAARGVVGVVERFSFAVRAAKGPKDTWRIDGVEGDGAWRAEGELGEERQERAPGGAESGPDGAHGDGSARGPDGAHGDGLAPASSALPAPQEALSPRSPPSLRDGGRLRAASSPSPSPSPSSSTRGSVREENAAFDLEELYKATSWFFSSGRLLRAPPGRADGCVQLKGPRVGLHPVRDRAPFVGLLNSALREVLLGTSEEWQRGDEQAIHAFSEGGGEGRGERGRGGNDAGEGEGSGDDAGEGEGSGDATGEGEGWGRARRGAPGELPSGGRAADGADSPIASAAAAAADGASPSSSRAGPTPPLPSAAAGLGDPPPSSSSSPPSSSSAVPDTLVFLSVQAGFAGFNQHSELLDSFLRSASHRGGSLALVSPQLNPPHWLLDALRRSRQLDIVALVGDPRNRANPDLRGPFRVIPSAYELLVRHYWSRIVEGPDGRDARIMGLAGITPKQANALLHAERRAARADTHGDAPPEVRHAQGGHDQGGHASELGGDAPGGGHASELGRDAPAHGAAAAAVSDRARECFSTSTRLSGAWDADVAARGLGDAGLPPAGSVLLEALDRGVMMRRLREVGGPAFCPRVEVPDDMVEVMRRFELRVPAPPSGATSVPASGSRALLRWREPGRDLGALGLWFWPAGADAPAATAVGSAGYSVRAVRRDLGMQGTVLTRNEGLRARLGREANALAAHASGHRPKTPRAVASSGVFFYVARLLKHYL